MDKDYILSEIKRTAVTNGGVALGQIKFRKETGITSGDWSKHWVRWGDVIRAAGLEPNKLQSRYDDNKLIERLVALVRELQHFPVFAEMRMKHRRDPTFPGKGTIERLGGKQALVALVEGYCRKNAGYDDVLAICTSIANAPEPQTESEKVPAEALGSVYLLRSGRYHKIGHSNAIGRRERELAIQLPDKANVVHVIRTDDPAGIEAYWHKRFSAKRKNGEWFSLSVSDVQAFRRRKFM